MLIVVSVESSLCSLRSSSCCVSRMIVYDRLEAKPKAGVKKDIVEPWRFCRSIIKLFSNNKLLCTHFLSGRSVAWSRTRTSIDAAVATVRTHAIRRPKNGLDTANAATLERCQTILLYA